MPWIIGAGALAGGAISGMLGSSSAKKQVDAMREAIAENRRQYNETVGRMAPYVEFGGERLNKLGEWLDDPSKQPSAYLDPGYEFRRTEGLKGVTGNAGTAGTLQSGDTLRALEQYGQGLASTEYGNAFNRWLQEGKFKQDLAGMGQSAAANLGYLGNQSSSINANLTSDLDAGAPERVWADIAGGFTGAGINALARRYNTPAPTAKIPGGSNIFYSEGE